MKIVVLGAGAIGLVFGGFLANSGNTVALLGRKEHIDPIRERGLLVEGIWGNHLVRNLTGYIDITQLAHGQGGDFELALITVKSYGTEAVLESFRACVKEPIPTVSLQNGFGNFEHVLTVMGQRNAMAGSVLFGAEAFAPGRVRVAVYAEQVKVGGVDGGIDFGLVQDVARVFSAAGIPSVATRDIHRHLWGKMLYNCALNALGAILGVRYGALMENESSRALITSIITEIFHVLQKEGIEVDWADADSYLRDLFDRLLPLTYDHLPSMLQDLQRHKRTEIDALNGAIVTLAGRHGLDAPVNWLVTKLVKVKEQLN